MRRFELIKIQKKSFLQTEFKVKFKLSHNLTMYSSKRKFGGQMTIQE